MSLPPGPISFSPVLKRIIWGGRRLGQRLGKPIGAGDDYAESWELVDRTNDQSIVDQGPLAGLSISQLIHSDATDLLGRYAAIDRFPLLFKYLDCQRVLSVQVHPDDEYALQMPQPDLGKTEAWYIVEAAENSVVYAGLKSGVDRKLLSEAVLAGRTADVLHSFHPTAGQCLFIPAGTVHALGDGLLVAEVQQSSDTTFRLFDWNRADANGRQRDLHVHQALEVTDYERGPIWPQTSSSVGDGWRTLVDCDKFLLRLANRDDTLNHPLVVIGDDSPVVLMVTKGTVQMAGSGWEPRLLTAGQTVLLPACCGDTTLWLQTEDANVLEIRLP